MITRRDVVLVLVLALTVVGDTLFSIGLIWTVVSWGGSTVNLGLLLALIALAPYLVQRAFPSVSKWMATHPEFAFSLTRILGMGVCVLGLVLGTDSTATLYLLAGLFSVGYFLSQQVVEVLVAGGVLGGRMSANHGARLLQTATQIGAFGGAALAGVALDVGGMTAVLWANIATVTISAVGITLLRAAPAHVEKSELEASAATEESRPAKSDSGFIRWASAGVLLLVTVQLAAFNFLVPIIANRVHGWSATEFGLIDAFAGCASFAAILAGSSGLFGRSSWAFGCVFIGVFNWTLASVGVISIVIPVLVFAAFFVTMLRISQYELLYGAYEDAEQAARWSLNLVLALTLVKALTPLMLGAVLVLVLNQANRSLVDGEKSQENSKLPVFPGV
jgi:hypothetical protein